MAGRITFTMIKPFAVENNLVGPILSKINEAGFRISAIKSVKMTRSQAEEFYAMHRGKDFFEGLTEFMSSGPIIAAILEKDNAVEEFRTLIGNTDPEKAAPGTIRKLFAQSVRKNAIHGSDCDESAERECSFFFSMIERF
jgi:nucleoside-diphosphate kinase